MWLVFWECCPPPINPYEIVLALIPESLILKEFPAMVSMLNDLELFTDAIANTCNRARKESNNAHSSEIGNFV